MEKTEIKNLARLSLSEDKGGMENVVFIKMAQNCFGRI
jgi:hypothetical protein